MIKPDRQTLLQTLEERHETLIEELGALADRVEAALAACGAAAPHATANGGASLLAPPSRRRL